MAKFMFEKSLRKKYEFKRVKKGPRRVNIVIYDGFVKFREYTTVRLIDDKLVYKPLYFVRVDKQFVKIISYEPLWDILYTMYENNDDGPDGPKKSQQRFFSEKENSRT